MGVAENQRRRDLIALVKQSQERPTTEDQPDQKGHGMERRLADLARLQQAPHAPLAT